jgi:hypothetical protein
MTWPGALMPGEIAMSFARFACVTLGLLVSTGPALTRIPPADDQQADKKDDVVRLSGASSPAELERRVAELLSNSTRGELGSLVSVADNATAMASGWERVRRTMPESRHEDVVSPDLLAISRFLGLIEGRIQVPIPTSWEESLKSARGYDQRSVGFPPPNAADTDPRVSKMWLPSRDGHHWVVKRENESVRISAEDGLGSVHHAAVARTRDRTFVALYGADAGPYRLLAIDEGTTKVLWSSNVWADGGLNARTGAPGWHIVTLHPSAESLVVFGASFSAMYVELFELKTGQSRCRFSTAYFNRVEPK